MPKSMIEQTDLTQLEGFLEEYAKNMVGWANCPGFRIVWDPVLCLYNLELKGRAEGAPCRRVLTPRVMAQVIQGSFDPTAIIDQMRIQALEEQRERLRVNPPRESYYQFTQDPDAPEDRLYMFSSRRRGGRGYARTPMAPSQAEAYRNLSYDNAGPVSLSGHLTQEERDALQADRQRREEERQEQERRRRVQDLQMELDRLDATQAERVSSRVGAPLETVTQKARRVRVAG